MRCQLLSSIVLWSAGLKMSEQWRLMGWDHGQCVSLLELTMEDLSGSYRAGEALPLLVQGQQKAEG